MIFAAATGVLAFLATVVVGLVYRSAPTRLACPDCGESTSVLQPPPLLRRTRLLTWRWCHACGWEGMGRNGPEWRPGQRLVAHDSGFHWGDERLPEDFGFRWARQMEAPRPTRPPHHPSGFRFGQPEALESFADHPSGFSWRDRPSQPAARPAPPPATSHPSGFRWGRPAADAPVFEWGDQARRDETDPGFRFRGEA